MKGSKVTVPAKVPAADHTLRILKLLAASRGPLPASMIATQLELPRSSVYHLLEALQQHGFVMHLAEERRYGLGLAAVELSSAYARQDPLARLGKPLLAALVDRIRVSAHLALLHGSDVLYIVEERAPGAPALVTGVDVRLPAHLTASGRAILSAMPRAQVRALYPGADAFVHRDGHSDAIDRYSRLRTVLDEALVRGYSIERGAITPGFSSIAQPVLDHRGWPVAGLAITFPTDSMPEERWPQLATAVGEAAQTLSTRIHGRRAEA